MSCPFDIPELVDRVIDHLHADTQSLRSCMLVARCWVPSSRFHFFRDTVAQGMHELEWLEKTLKATPVLGHHFRSLTIRSQYPNQFHAVPSSRVLGLTRATPELSALKLHSLDFMRWEQNCSPENIPTAGESIRELTIAFCLFDDHFSFACALLAFPCLQQLSIIGPATSKTQRAQIGGRINSISHMRRIYVEELRLEDIWDDDLAPILAVVLNDISPRVIHLLIGHEYDYFALLSLCELFGSRMQELHLLLSTRGGEWSGEDLPVSPPVPLSAEVHLALDTSARISSYDLYLMLENIPESLLVSQGKILEFDLRSLRGTRSENDITSQVKWTEVCATFRRMCHGEGPASLPKFRVLLPAEDEEWSEVEMIRMRLSELREVGIMEFVHGHGA